ncbi:hypothetical protein [uncultured Ruegeria sp.]|uniref:hypothetical protein n=1 Tax=uncultured Ruegeria sp. TaxID=259304 RepID=UPI0026166426|nr:hypothetical protein [uncultured Ruegeria sp.]
MKIKKTIPVLGVCGTLFTSACAQQPGSITPVSMGDTYSDVSCSRAANLYKQESAKVPTLVAAQKNAVTGDALGVFLIGVPVSSLSGADLEGEIAATKGKLIALAGRLEACGTSPAAVAWG